MSTEFNSHGPNANEEVPQTNERATFGDCNAKTRAFVRNGTADSIVAGLERSTASISGKSRHLVIA